MTQLSCISNSKLNTGERHLAINHGTIFSDTTQVILKQNGTIKF